MNSFEDQKSKPILVQINTNENGRLKSIYQYVDRNLKRDIYYCYIPKWLFTLISFFTFAILLILIIVAIIFSQMPRNALHGESCTGRSCVNNLGLHCINQTCECTPGYVYIDKCTLRKSYGEKCNLTNICKENTNIICLNGFCLCNSTQYWNSQTCVNQVTFGKSCSSTSQCITSLMLYCNTVCTCPSSRFWDGTVCYPQRTFNEKCSSTAQCLTSKNLICQNSFCKCDSSRYWDLNYLSCLNTLIENATCNQDNQCKSPMNCTLNGMCQCNQNFYYFDQTSSSCLPQGSYLASCTIEYNCRVDKYLECSNGACQCITTYPVWSNGFGKCIIPASYSQACYATSDCITSLSLVCNVASTSCSCPTNLSSNKCDCQARVFGNEYYWNGSSCISALSYNQSCSNSFMCQTLTQGTTCSTSAPQRCQCSPLQYFNFSDNKCETLLSINSTCTQIDACNSALGLSCQNGICQCNIATQFWSSSSCTNYFTYNSQTCSNNNQCAGNLICRSNSWWSCNSCSCPSNVCSNKCDCPTPVVGSEYYWNGTFCEISGVYSDLCTASYECQALTQMTYCNTLTGKCDCTSNTIWNGTICEGCPPGWILYRSSCFFGSNTKISNPETNFNALADCNGFALARLAILYTTDVGNIFASSMSQPEYWIDFYRTTSFGTFGTFYSSNNQSSDSYINTDWDKPWANNEQCATWMTQPNKAYFNSHQCSNNREVMCEIVL